MKKMGIALASLALFVGCASHNASSEVGGKDTIKPLALEGQNLKIEKIVVGGKSFNPENMEENPNISFEKNKFYGSAGCNRFFGNYKKDDMNLQIDGAASTQMLCHPQSVMEFESTFLTNFNGNFKIINENDKIILESGETKIYLK
ncbi:META domain-containing protein [Campylobacter helveticus]|uniref:META domain-containing protein n=1 Tax=Campylobacter helveticus TaxID=28898 RepID=UPI0011174137|nr:META domain-containing protein [Campylobacter helveticus]TNH35126.1 META domain-containing protein [Campylobacter helveticus]TNH37140.1 META domain-containing protein [Campylobacter helveticus]